MFETYLVSAISSYLLLYYVCSKTFDVESYDYLVLFLASILPVINIITAILFIVIYTYQLKKQEK